MTVNIYRNGKLIDVVESIEHALGHIDFLSAACPWNEYTYRVETP